MKNLRLTIPLKTFEEEIVTFLKNDEIESNYNNLVSENEFFILKSEVENWQNNLFTILKNSFKGNDNYFYDKISSRDYSIETRINKFKDKTLTENRDLLIKKHIQHKDFIFDFKNVLPVLEMVIGSKPFYSIQNMSPLEIFYLILNKLKILKNGNYFRIDLILEGNGVELKNGIQEFFEYVEEFKKNKWVEFENDYLGRITLKGEIYLEKQKKIFSQKESEEISNKINYIINKIDKLGYGQEILFNELEELKNLYPKLNKKNWSQIIKGKLIDLAIDKVIDMSVIKIITDDLLEKDFSKFISQ